MIIRYELHVETSKNLSELATFLTSKGYQSEMLLCKDGMVKLVVRNPTNNKMHHYYINLKEEDNGIYVYEFGAWGKDEFSFLETFASSI